MNRFALSVLLVVGLAFGTVSAEETATIWGLVLDGAGHPAPGYGVVIQDAATGATWTSPASSPAGQYQLPVAVGGSYRTVGVVTLGGARFSLDPGVPIQARRAVRYRLDVRLPGTAPTSSSAEAGPARAVAQTPGADDRAPWWKSPAGITGLVAVNGAVLAIILSNNDEETAASPSSP